MTLINFYLHTYISTNHCGKLSDRLFNDSAEYIKIQFIYGNLKRLKLCWPHLKAEDKNPQIGPVDSTVFHVIAREGNLKVFKYICSQMGRSIQDINAPNRIGESNF